MPGIVGGKHVPRAVAAGQASANLCTIAGMLLGGALYKLIGMPGVLLLNAGSNLLAAAMESGIRTAPVVVTLTHRGARAVGEMSRFAAELRDGLRQVRADRTVFALLLVNTAFTLAVLPIAMVYMPYLFNVILGAAPLQAAVPQAATWVGIIVGSGAAARLLRRRRADTLIAGGLLALAIHTFLMVALIGARNTAGDFMDERHLRAGQCDRGSGRGLLHRPALRLVPRPRRRGFSGPFLGTGKLPSHGGDVRRLLPRGHPGAAAGTGLGLRGHGSRAARPVCRGPPVADLSGLLASAGGVGARPHAEHDGHDEQRRQGQLLAGHAQGCYFMSRLGRKVAICGKRNSSAAHSTRPARNGTTPR